LKSNFAIIALVLAAGFLTPAQSSTVLFTGNTVNGTSYGPYDLVVNGVATLGTCINNNLTISSGETWTADADPIIDFSATTSPTATVVLEAEYLNWQFTAANSSNWTYIQEAIWNLTGASFTSGQPATSPQNPLYWTNLAAAGYPSVSPGSFYVLVPEAGTQSVGGLPQAFLINLSAPEPGTFVLAGTAFIGLGAMLRRRRRQV